jgi:hypothetical protein
MPKWECEEFDWVKWTLLPGELNGVQWQATLKLSLPLRGGRFTVDFTANHDAASTGRKPHGFLKLLGHEFDIEAGGGLEGLLGPNPPYYVMFKALNLHGSISKKWEWDAGLTESLNLLTPLGPTIAGVISSVPDLRRWANERAKFYVEFKPSLAADMTFDFQPTSGLRDLKSELSAPVKLGASADLWAIEANIYGGLRIVGRLGYDSDEISLASVSANGLGGYKFRVAWFVKESEGEWKLATYPPDPQPASGQLAVATAQASPWHLIPAAATPQLASLAATLSGLPACARLSLAYPVPSSGGAHRLYAVADPAGLIVEQNETDNQASLAAFGPDLELRSAGVQDWGESQVGLTAVIQNSGSSSPATSIRYTRETASGALKILTFPSNPHTQAHVASCEAPMSDTPDSPAQQIAELEVGLTQPMPAAVRRLVEQRLATGLIMLGAIWFGGCCLPEE